MAPKALTIRKIVAANLSRVEKWHSLNDWTPLEWAGAMCGEAGEMANAAKKLKRVESGISNHDGRLSKRKRETRAKLMKHYKRQMLKEFADTLIYGLLTCSRVGATAAEIEQAVRTVFNQKSIEYRFPERL